MEEIAFDENLPNSNDWDVFVRFAQRRPIAFVQEPLYLRRIGAHASITTNAKLIELEEIEARTRAADKHREWLGEKYYRRRMARIFLSYIGVKQNRFGLLLYSLYHAGMAATMWLLWQKILRKEGKI